jgi:hypothetical protein
VSDPRPPDESPAGSDGGTPDQGSAPSPGVQIAPNRSHIRGRVVGVRDPADPSGFMEVTVELDEVSPAQNMRSMVRQQAGESIPVLMAPDLVERLGIREGVVVDGDIRRAGLDRSFVQPDRIRVAAVDEDTAADGQDESVPATAERRDPEPGGLTGS